MTSFARGDVVEASDPFTDTKPSRPFLIVSTESHPFHGEQYVAMTLTTRTWYTETIPLDSDDFVDGGVPAESSIVPWGVASPGHDDIAARFGQLDERLVDRAVERLFGYLTA